MVAVECLFAPRAYSREQIRFSLAFAEELGRGRFLLCEKPAHCPLCFDELGEYCTRCGRS